MAVVRCLSGQSSSRTVRRLAPAEAWQASAPAQPGPPIAQLPEATLRTVTKLGVVNYRQAIIGLGRALTGAQVLIISRGDDIAIFGPGGLLRRLLLQPGIRTYPNGKSTGPHPRARIIGPCN